MLSLLMFFCPLVVKAQCEERKPQEEIAEAALIGPMPEEAIIYLLGEKMYLSETDGRGNKVATKFNNSKYEKKDRKAIDQLNIRFGEHLFRLFNRRFSNLN